MNEKVKKLLEQLEPPTGGPLIENKFTDEEIKAADEEFLNFPSPVLCSRVNYQQKLNKLLKKLMKNL